MERVFTTRTATSIICQFVQIPAVTAGAKSLLVFEAFSQQMSSGFVLVTN